MSQVIRFPGSVCLRPFSFPMISLPDMILSDLLRRSEGLLEIQVAYHIGITLSGYNIASASDFVNSFWGKL